ncbi:MAG: hypothetical protein JWQ27_1950 [Ferruginibacter sp.]|nr:hypothetical protein [Ferruginibacter sp.]
MSHFIYNGKSFPAETAIIGPDNRGLRFGDGLFETIKFINGELIMPDEHFARLWKGLQMLDFSIPKLFTPEKLEQEIKQLVKKNQHAAARVRLTVFRGNGGLYDAENNIPNYLIQTWALPANNGKLNSNGLQLCIYHDAQKNCDKFSNLKHNNFLPYFMGAAYAKKEQCNDALILNNQQRICESTIANLFIIRNGVVITPPLSEGCIAGTMRKAILTDLTDSPFDLVEAQIDEAMLRSAEEVFLSNSIYNIRWVAGLGEKQFGNDSIKKIYMYLQQTNPGLYC